MPADEALDLMPVTFVVPDLFAIGADWQEPPEGIDLFQGDFQLFICVALVLPLAQLVDPRKANSPADVGAANRRDRKYQRGFPPEMVESTVLKQHYHMNDGKVDSRDDLIAQAAGDKNENGDEIRQVGQRLLICVAWNIRVCNDKKRTRNHHPGEGPDLEMADLLEIPGGDHKYQRDREEGKSDCDRKGAKTAVRVHLTLVDDKPKIHHPDQQYRDIEHSPIRCLMPLINSVVQFPPGW